MNIQALSLNSNILSLGALLGTTGTQELIDGINQRAGAGNFFGSALDPFSTGFQHFMSEVMTPIYQIQDQLSTAVNQIFKKDEIRAIDSIEELEQGIPPCMMYPIIYYAPVRQMLEEERIDGFGIDPRNLDPEDPYESLLKSGVIENITSDTLNDDCELEFTWTEKTGDPELTIEEQYAISDTRRFIDLFMENDETKHLDFTNYPRLHA